MRSTNARVNLPSDQFNNLNSTSRVVSGPFDFKNPAVTVGAPPDLGTQSAPKGSEPECPVHSKALADGTLIETVRDAMDPTRFRLLVFKDGTVKITDSYKYGGEVFVPYKIAPSLARKIHVPSGMNPSGQLRQLLSDLAATLQRYIDLPDQGVRLISRFILSAWIPEHLLVAPYLWLVGPPASGKTTLLKLLQALCRRALLISNVKPAALYELPRLLDPTLLIDESGLGNSGMIRLLRAGSTRGASSVIYKDQAYDCYGCKVLSSPEIPSDTALASRAIFIGMSPTNRTVLPLHEAAVEHIAAEFQPKLLGFRLQNYSGFGISETFPATTQNFTPRIRDLACALAVPLLGDAKLEDELVHMLGEQDHDARMNRAHEPEWLVAEELFGICHCRQTTEVLRKGYESVLVGGVAKRINKRMEMLDEEVRLTAKKTGSVLGSLGIRPKSLGSIGHGIIMTPSIREDIHRVAQRLGISRRNLMSIFEPDCGAPCTLCEKFNLTAGLKFTNMKKNASRSSE